MWCYNGHKALIFSVLEQKRNIYIHVVHEQMHNNKIRFIMYYNKYHINIICFIVY
jgi:hypothetical protein